MHTHTHTFRHISTRPKYYTNSTVGLLNDAEGMEILSALIIKLQNWMPLKRALCEFNEMKAGFYDGEKELKRKWLMKKKKMRNANYNPARRFERCSLGSIFI